MGRTKNLIRHKEERKNYYETEWNQECKCKNCKCKRNEKNY